MDKKIKILLVFLPLVLCVLCSAIVASQAFPTLYNINITGVTGGFVQGYPAGYYAFDANSYLTITAVPEAGYGFVRWEITEGLIVDDIYNSSTTVFLGNDGIITPVFGPLEPLWFETYFTGFEPVLYFNGELWSDWFAIVHMNWEIRGYTTITETNHYDMAATGARFTWEWKQIVNQDDDNGIRWVAQSDNLNGTAFASSAFYSEVWYKPQYLLEIGTINGGGTVDKASQWYYLEELSVGISITATPNEGYLFAGWIANGEVIIEDPHNATTVIIADGHGAVYAIFSRPPVAEAGTDQDLNILASVNLDGSGSYDLDSDSITFRWSFLSVPSSSAATLTGANSASSSFTPDVYGDYEVLLIVSDHWLSSADTVVIHVSGEGNVVSDLQDLRADIISLNASAFTAPSLRSTMITRLDKAIAYVQAGEYTLALDQFVNSILKYTDGCALYGAPDRTDWIRTSAAQAIVYPEVVEAMELVLQLMEG